MWIAMSERRFCDERRATCVFKMGFLSVTNGALHPFSVVRISFAIANYCVATTTDTYTMHNIQ